MSIKGILRFDAKAIRTLNIKGMINNHYLAQAIDDSAWSSFVTKLKYKSKSSRKIIFLKGKFEPSSKIYHVLDTRHLSSNERKENLNGLIARQNMIMRLIPQLRSNNSLY